MAILVPRLTLPPGAHNIETPDRRIERSPRFMLDGLKARLERLLAEAGHADGRTRAAMLREALIDARTGVGVMRDALAAVEQELSAERKRLEDAERRGRLAAEVPDPETVAVAERFATQHRERVALLERKVAVQRDELAMAQREEATISAEFRAARIGADHTSRPVVEPEDNLEYQSDQRAREAAVEAQLAYLKKKLGKDR